MVALLQNAMKVELSTIPLYLTAAWSIKTGELSLPRFFPCFPVLEDFLLFLCLFRGNPGEYGPFTLDGNEGLTEKQMAAGTLLERAISNIVSEEMLHLSLAGNILAVRIN